MQNWAVELAKEFKNRDNKDIQHIVLGTVVKEFPDIKIKIKDGIILTKNNLVIASSLLEGYNREFEVQNINGTTNSVNDGGQDASSHSHILTSLQGNIVYKDYGLKNGDEVILLTNDEQLYFAIDKGVRL